MDKIIAKIITNIVEVYKTKLDLKDKRISQLELKEITQQDKINDLTLIIIKLQDESKKEDI